MADEPEYGRRNFLKSSAFSFVKTAQEFVKHRDAKTEETPVKTFRADWLRPPGAVEELTFLERCTKCGDCVPACPYEAIQLSGRDGTPEIFPDVKPCYLCEDFPCISACGTEALMPVSGQAGVAMGLAKVAHRACTASQGCNACVPKCPLHAIEMDFGTLRVVVASEQCVGCGICEQVCMAVNDKIAIKVFPTRLQVSP